MADDFFGSPGWVDGTKECEAVLLYESYEVFATAAPKGAAVAF